MNPLNLAAWCAALFLAANLFPHSVALRLTLLALGLALVVFELARARLAGRPAGVQSLPPLLVPILLWAAWAALSVTWSVEPERSIKEFKNEVGYVFLGYWLCWVAAQAPGARRAFVVVLGAGATLTCVVGLYVYLVPASHPWLLRMASGPGDQSSALLTLMPCALIAIWLAREDNAPRAAASRPLGAAAAHPRGRLRDAQPHRVARLRGGDRGHGSVGGYRGRNSRRCSSLVAPGSSPGCSRRRSWAASCWSRFRSRKADRGESPARQSQRIPGWRFGLPRSIRSKSIRSPDLDSAEELIANHCTRNSVIRSFGTRTT